MRRRFLVGVLGAVSLIPAVHAATFADSIKAASPPLYPSNAKTRTAEFELKRAPLNDGHGFVVVSGPDGKLLELRGGSSRGGGGSDATAPGSDPASSGDQPSGNPFQCVTTHPWGVVVPYVGLHGVIGVDASGAKTYLADGNVPAPLYRVPIGKGGQTDVCAMANCMMTIIKAPGASCKLYMAGTGTLRNSNTLISMALSSCGVRDPLPSTFPATGWGSGWE